MSSASLEAFPEGEDSAKLKLKKYCGISSVLC
jgi:hypothetical protein